MSKLQCCYDGCVDRMWRKKFDRVGGEIVVPFHDWGGYVCTYMIGFIHNQRKP